MARAELPLAADDAMDFAAEADRLQMDTDRPLPAVVRARAVVDESAAFDCGAAYLAAHLRKRSLVGDSDLALRMQLMRAGEATQRRAVRTSILRDYRLNGGVDRRIAAANAAPEENDARGVLERVTGSLPDRAFAGAPSAASVESFRWNIQRLERGWRGSPTRQGVFTFSNSTNRVVQKDAPQLIPGLVGTPGAYEHKTPPEADVAGGLDVSFAEFANVIRHGRPGVQALLREHALLFSALSDCELRKLFDRFDEDKSNSISFDEFYNALQRWHDEKRAARDRVRRLRESVAWRGEVNESDFVRKVRSAGKVGAFGRVEAGGKMLMRHSDADLRKLFRRIDGDGNGGLSATEFLAGLEDLDGSAKETRANRLPAPSRPQTAA
ncbi:hypothetical protein M885DRAFT_512824 [Pelagophyceae sp. CCMP2097]|nr:hypothetical protein M885DRAFT_512824 [Pelagophyceae sp. CCMP2097]